MLAVGLSRAGRWTEAPDVEGDEGPVTCLAMANPNRWVRAARGPLARLIAVLTAVAGFALMHAPHCVDGMTPTAHLVTTADHAMSGMAGVGHPSGAGDVGPSAVMSATTAGAVQVTSDDEPTSGSLLMTCLALLVTVLGAVVVLRRSLIPLDAPIPRWSGVPVRPREPLPPCLFQLCILRT